MVWSNTKAHVFIQKEKLLLHMYFINNYEHPLSINITWILLHVVTQGIIHHHHHHHHLHQQQHYHHHNHQQQKQKYQVIINKGKKYQSAIGDW